MVIGVIGVTMCPHGGTWFFVGAQGFGFVTEHPPTQGTFHRIPRLAMVLSGWSHCMVLLPMLEPMATTASSMAAATAATAGPAARAAAIIHMHQYEIDELEQFL